MDIVLKDNSKLVATKFSLVDIIICNRPGWLFSIIASAASASNGSYIMRNGFDTSAEEVFSTIVSRYYGQIMSFNPPLYFSKGIFLDVTATILGATVQYLAEELPE